jgi:DNA-binding NarL/FixJ family response regulator
MIRLVLADDHAMLREGLRSKFETCEDIRVVGEAATAAELMRGLAAKPDVVVLDMKLPDANGITMVREVKLRQPACRVIILTMYDHARYAAHAFESGADGFVVKGSPFEELLQAVRAVAAGGTYTSPSMTAKLMAHAKRGKRKGSLESLSQREFEVLILLCSGLAVKEVAFQLSVSEKSVTTYRARVMEKLQLSNKTELIRFAIEAGLID